MNPVFDFGKALIHLKSVGKVARALNGDPNHADDWHDIQGYAKLVENRITEAAK